MGWVEGGARTLLDALVEVLGPEGTLVSDAFIPMYPLPLTHEDAKKISDDNSPTYAGAFCAAMIQHPEMVRSRHPVQKGVAIGAMANDLMLSHSESSPAYEPLQRMALAGGKHLSIDRNVIGVGTTHVAQNLLDLQQKTSPLGINYLDDQGNIALFKINWVGGCAEGFPKFFPLYEKMGGIVARGNVGKADSVITDMKKTLEIELDKLEKDPAFFLCDNPGCIQCRLTWAFSTGKAPVVYLVRFMKSMRQKSPLALWRSVSNWFARRRST